MIDKLTCLSQVASLPAFFQRGIAFAPPQIVENRARKQDVVLKNHRHIVAKRLNIVFPHIHTANFHCAAVHIVKTAHHTRQGGFTAASASNHTEGLSRPHTQHDMLKCRTGDGLLHLTLLVGHRLIIRKRGVGEFHTTVFDDHHRILRRCDVGFLVKHLTDAPAVGSTHRDAHKYHREHHQ